MLQKLFPAVYFFYTTVAVKAVFYSNVWAKRSAISKKNVTPNTTKGKASVPVGHFNMNYQSNRLPNNTTLASKLNNLFAKQQNKVLPMRP